MTEITEHSEDFYDEMNKVVEFYLKGTKDATTIAKYTGQSRKEVVRYIDEWKAISKTSEYAKARAEEAVISIDKNYDMIVEEQWAIVNDGATDVRTRASVLKQIADVEAKRYEIVERAGWKDDGSLTDELVLAQERADGMKKILVTLAQENPALKTRILSLMSGVEKEIVVVPETIQEGKTTTD